MNDFVHDVKMRGNIVQILRKNMKFTIPYLRQELLAVLKTFGYRICCICQCSLLAAAVYVSGPPICVRMLLCDCMSEYALMQKVKADYIL